MHKLLRERTILGRHMSEQAVIETQCAALAVRHHDRRTEVLLVTSRETRRWVIPKGWPMNGKSHAESAAREAFEEGGIEGRVDPKPLGTFTYDKRKKSGALMPCRVEVFRLDVRTEHASWPEAHERHRKWVTPDQAATMVQEPELAALIRRVV